MSEGRNNPTTTYSGCASQVDTPEALIPNKQRHLINSQCSGYYKIYLLNKHNFLFLNKTRAGNVLSCEEKLLCNGDCNYSGQFMTGFTGSTGFDKAGVGPQYRMQPYYEVSNVGMKGLSPSSRVMASIAPMVFFRAVEI